MPQGPRTERVGEGLSEADLVAMACHVNPDADALGSMLGLAQHLVARDTEVTCSFPNNPPNLPRWADMLPGLELLVPPNRFPRSPAVMVTCDCASFDRLGMLEPSATAAKELIWIDHHRSNDGSGTIRLVDPDASSTCELVARLIDEIGGELTRESALCLYAGLVTDTGRFQYEAVTSQTLRLAARLREHDFDHARLPQVFHEAHGAAYPPLVGPALSPLQEVPEAELVWTYLTQGDLAEAGNGPGETEALIDVVRTARGADVAAILQKQPDGRFKVRVRWRGAGGLVGAAG